MPKPCLSSSKSYSQSAKIKKPKNKINFGIEVEAEAELEAEDSDIGEYDTTDPFVNDSKFEELPPMQLGLRPKEQITATRKRKRTDRYVPIEQVDGDEYVSEYDESDESDDHGSESEYDPSE